MSAPCEGMNNIVTTEAERRAAFERTLAELRPRLLRYCARMVGSSVDGEDVVQDTFVKALTAFDGQVFASVERWAFSIAHNSAIDFLRRRARLEQILSDEDPDMSIDAKADAAEQVAARAGLQHFMNLPVTQRGCAILIDILGYSLKEVGDVTGMTVPAVKAALSRGRARLREIVQQPMLAGQHQLSQSELSRLSAYADRFNARDFEAVRDMLADDVRCELVSRTVLEGKAAVSTYFGNYARVLWNVVPGLADGRPALLAFDPREPETPFRYFVLLEFDGARVRGIRDFIHARYAALDADMVALGAAANSS